MTEIFHVARGYQKIYIHIGKIKEKSAPWNTRTSTNKVQEPVVEQSLTLEWKEVI